MTKYSRCEGSAARAARGLKMNTVMVIISIKLVQAARHGSPARAMAVVGVCRGTVAPVPQELKPRESPDAAAATERGSATPGRPPPIVAVMAGMPAFSGARDIREAVRLRRRPRSASRPCTGTCACWPSRAAWTRIHGAGRPGPVPAAPRRTRPTTSPAAPAGARSRSTGARSGNGPRQVACLAPGSPSPGTRCS